jgi:imidazole glycerol-phosphate synthase subunit HisH
VRFPGDLNGQGTGARLKVPHMGWNEVYQTLVHPLWEGIADGTRFYFVHSYYFAARGRPSSVIQPLSLLLCLRSGAQANLFAVQFHPEKSQAAGLKLLAKFSLHWDPGPHAFSGVAA